MAARATTRTDVPIEPQHGRAGQGRVLDQLSINTIRTLSMDAVHRQFRPPRHADGLGDGRLHGMAELPALRPHDPIWPNRDRFVLSNGHASMLLYAMLYLTGVKAVDAKYERLGEPSVTLDDIERFRQLGSKCPGPPRVADLPHRP